MNARYLEIFLFLISNGSHICEMKKFVEFTQCLSFKMQPDEEFDYFFL